MLAEAAGDPAPPLSVGFTYELCAGIIDKEKSLAHIAAEEVGPHHQYASQPNLT